MTSLREYFTAAKRGEDIGYDTGLNTVLLRAAGEIENKIISLAKGALKVKEAASSPMASFSAIAEVLRAPIFPERIVISDIEYMCDTRPPDFATAQEIARLLKKPVPKYDGHPQQDIDNVRTKVTALPGYATLHAACAKPEVDVMVIIEENKFTKKLQIVVYADTPYAQSPDKNLFTAKKKCGGASCGKDCKKK